MELLSSSRLSLCTRQRNFNGGNVEDPYFEDMKKVGFTLEASFRDAKLNFQRTISGVLCGLFSWNSPFKNEVIGNISALFDGLKTR